MLEQLCYRLYKPFRSFRMELNKLLQNMEYYLQLRYYRVLIKNEATRKTIRAYGKNNEGGDNKSAEPPNSSDR